MNRRSPFHLALLLAALALGACVNRSVVIEQGPHGEPVVVEAPEDAPNAFEPVAGRGPDVVATLRAAPAPAQPEFIDGRNLVADQRALAARSFVLVGEARFDTTDVDAHAKALEIGREVGADQIYVYTSHVDGDAGHGSARYLARYFVRFKLLFGATFRNLTATERTTLDVAGGVQIGSVVGGTPASQANLLAGDYVLAVNAQSFNDRGEFQALLRDHAGKPVTLTIRRNDITMDRVVRLGAMPAAGTP